MSQTMDEFILAIHEQNVEKVKSMLKDRKIDLNKDRYKPKSLCTDGEFTPLQFAAAVGNTAIIQVLLANGADPKAVSGFGRSALSIAASYGNIDACKLLAPFSDMLSRDHGRLEPYGNAEKGFNSAKSADRKRRCQEVKEFLRTPTYISAMRKDDEGKLLQKLVDDGVNYAKVFVIACRLGENLVVKKMLQQKCVDINVHYRGQTGLHTACSNGEMSVVYELLRHEELNINAQTTEECTSWRPGLTALHYVCRISTDELLDNPIEIKRNELSIRLDIADLLLVSGANVNLTDAAGQAPIHRAIVHNELDMVKLFVMRGADLTIKVKLDEDVIRKHIPNPRPCDFYADLLEFSYNQPAIRQFLGSAMQEGYSFGKGLELGGLFRLNFPNRKPFRLADSNVDPFANRYEGLKI
jgi:ankyrin repeat protein